MPEYQRVVGHYGPKTDALYKENLAANRSLEEYDFVALIAQILWMKLEPELWQKTVLHELKISATKDIQSSTLDVKSVKDLGRSDIESARRKK